VTSKRLKQADKSKADRVRAIMSDPEIREIAKLAAEPNARDFTFRLADYFTPLEIVLILRAAKASSLI
jgi:hypothetical protein